MLGCCFGSIPPPKLVYRAAKAGQEHTLRDLIGQEASIPNLLEWTDSLNRTPLIVAARKGYEGCVRLLLESGSNVHHQSVERVGGGNALHGAVYKRKSMKLIDLLLVFGSSPLARNQGGFSAMDYAISRNQAAQHHCHKYGFFSGVLDVQVHSREWQQVWIQIIPRHAHYQQRMGKILLMYSDRFSEQPDFDISLEGAKACVETDSSSGLESTCTLILKHSVNGSIRNPLHVCHRANGDIELCLRPSQPYGDTELFAFSRIINRPQLPTVRRLYMARAPPSHRSLPIVIPFDTTNLWTPTGISDADITEMVQNLQGAFETDTNFSLTEITQELNIHSDNESDAGVAGIPTDFIGSSTERRDSDTSCTIISPTCLDGLSMYSNMTFCSSPNFSDVASKVDECVGVSEVAFDVQRSLDEDLCVICLNQKREAGFFHGSSVHRCCCLECAKDLMESTQKKKCPICRQEIEHIVENVYL
ncbi:hypothetical protein BSKO_06656 [Bryopsis sp. KO-2023]|nr:hypothetical protein BSKO_06656 [Bryopsis sp. KO-2023]